VAEPEARRPVVFGLLVAAVAIGALAYVIPRALDAAAGPESDILVAVKAFERKGIELKFSFGVFTAQQLQYSRISVQLDGADQATVRSTLDLNGKLSRPDGTVTLVSSLGIETVTVKKASGGWEPVSPCPTIEAALRALEARRRAIESGEVGAVTAAPPDAELSQWLRLKDRHLRATAWYLRNERDGLLVSEDFSLSGDSPDKPLVVTGTKRLTLKAKGAEFFFPQGLM